MPGRSQCGEPSAGDEHTRFLLKPGTVRQDARASVEGQSASHGPPLGARSPVATGSEVHTIDASRRPRPGRAAPYAALVRSSCADAYQSNTLGMPARHKRSGAGAAERLHRGCSPVATSRAHGTGGRSPVGTVTRPPDRRGRRVIAVNLRRRAPKGPSDFAPEASGEPARPAGAAPGAYSHDIPRAQRRSAEGQAPRRSPVR